MVSKGSVDTLQKPQSFSIMQNDSCIFLQINLDTKEFNHNQAEPEVVVSPDSADEQPNAET